MGWRIDALLSIWRALQQADPPPTTKAWSEPLVWKPPLLEGVEPMGAHWCAKCREPWPNDPFFRHGCPTCAGETVHNPAKTPLSDAEVGARIVWPKKVLEQYPDHVKELNADLARLQAKALSRGLTWVDLVDFGDTALEDAA